MLPGSSSSDSVKATRETVKGHAKFRAELCYEGRASRSDYIKTQKLNAEGRRSVLAVLAHRLTATRGPVESGPLSRVFDHSAHIVSE